MIGKDGTYATLHELLQLTPGVNLESTKLTALNTDLQAQLADINMRRATISVPTTLPNSIVDEYAQEQAEAWTAQFDASNGTTITDASYAPFQAAGAITKETLKKFDTSCLTPVRSLSPTEIRAIRERGSCY